ncbi:tRNA (5-methylaminomethyl-2-thiouridine)(34)-methyltransferase MnmD [Sediminitomix flava]|uniref:tRNA U34 5-methylaminomethyl-2-thiouridine-forming methyltransferase MnmC n=1 Tax=Sediminitomix flava TaxID=379075 RepID=A0A315Z0C4_SEDFL|nr:tRNA (5-methylaminomethyl-2-thiouridine)(34)-methyltransferase MnmD [Sediminitomix flava]PWJ36002.1 tRNA U34 5-methylaminomethyl-2-thiouridine-forming methyltransferase MnmC [Sediminitomix flava]
MSTDKNIKVIETNDGSSTLFNEELNETYHSSHGALTESEYVFIKAGVEAILPTCGNHLKIFEVGFGTGLNAILTIKEALKHPDVQFHYVSVEAFPLKEEIVAQLNYKSLLDESLHSYFDQIHQVEWGKDISILPNFVLHKIDGKLEEFDWEAEYFDLIYFDAFAPSKQAEMWEKSSFDICYKVSAPQSMLVTYCANGQFKRTLKSANYIIEAYPGPPGKREMVRGLKGITPTYPPKLKYKKPE